MNKKLLIAALVLVSASSANANTVRGSVFIYSDSPKAIACSGNGTFLYDDTAPVVECKNR